MLRLRPWLSALVIFNAVAAFAAAPAARSEAAANSKESYQAALDAMRESSKNALESLGQSSKIALDAAHHELEVLTTVYSAAAGLIAALVAFGAFLGWTTLKEARTEFQAKLDGVLGTAKSRVEQHFQESSGALRNRLAAMDQQLKTAEEAAAKTSERLAIHVAAATELVETSFFYVVNREVYYKTGGDAELTRRMERDLERLARLTTEFQSDRLRRLIFKEQAVLYCKRGAISKAIAAQREALALEGEPEADLYYNLACYLAMQFSAAGATDKAQLEESVGLLRKAVELSSNFAETALKDADFADVFRQKPEFTQFLRDRLGTGERLKREG